MVLKVAIACAALVYALWLALLGVDVAFSTARDFISVFRPGG